MSLGIPFWNPQPSLGIPKESLVVCILASLEIPRDSTKAAADIYSPISGTITAVNMKLKEDVDLLNQSPEEGGYLFEIIPSHPEEIEALLKADDYSALKSK